MFLHLSGNLQVSGGILLQTRPCKWSDLLAQDSNTWDLHCWYSQWLHNLVMPHFLCKKPFFYRFPYYKGGKKDLIVSSWNVSATVAEVLDSSSHKSLPTSTNSEGEHKGSMKWELSLSVLKFLSNSIFSGDFRVLKQFHLGGINSGKAVKQHSSAYSTTKVQSLLIVFPTSHLTINT